MANQTTPAAGSWDGVADELEGPVVFQGDGTGFSFRAPIEAPGRAGHLENGRVTWGAVLDGTPSEQGRSAFYFAPRHTLTEVQSGTDLNGDGDRVDTFDVGEIRRRTWNAIDAAQVPADVTLTPAFVLQERCNWGGDLNSDGFDDPIFLWDPESQRLHVRVTVLTDHARAATAADAASTSRDDVPSEPAVRRARTVFFLRNFSN